MYVGMGGKTLQIDARGNKCNCFCCVRTVDETDGPKKRFACLLGSEHKARRDLGKGRDWNEGFPKFVKLGRCTIIF